MSARSSAIIARKLLSCLEHYERSGEPSGNHKKPEDDETQSLCQMNDAFGRCGNVFFPEEVMKMYIYKIMPAINSLLQRYGETYDECLFMEVVQEAKSEEDFLRAQRALPPEDPNQGLHL